MKRLAFVFAAAWVLALSGCAEAAPDTFFVQKVIDGDTLRLAGGEKVRLIGIDAPETYVLEKNAATARKTGKSEKAILELGKQSTEYVRVRVEGKRVRLEFDIERRDKYGRLLAYVFLEDGTFLNAELLGEGYAQILTIPPNLKYRNVFIERSRRAREQKKGLWK